MDQSCGSFPSAHERCEDVSSAQVNGMPIFDQCLIKLYTVFVAPQPVYCGLDEHELCVSTVALCLAVPGALDKMLCRPACISTVPACL